MTNKTQEKQYRIIEPIVEPRYSCNWIKKDNGLLIKVWNDVNEEDYFIEVNNIGDIVPFSQLEEWMEVGIHPIYFTEEVIERRDNFYVDIGHMNKIADGHYEASNEFYNNNKKLKEILSNGTFIDNYNLKGFFISEDNLSEEEQALIEEIKKDEV